MIKRSSSLLKLRMWSSLRTIRTRMLPRIRMNSKTIPRKVGMLVPPNKAPVVLNRVQVPSKALAAKKMVLAQAVPCKAQVARKTDRAQARAVPNKALVARKTDRVQVRAVPNKVLVAQVARKMALAQVRAARKMVLALAESPARRMNTSLIKRRNSRSMIGEK